MNKITILPHSELCKDGMTIYSECDKNICDILLESGVMIEHACEKSCACATCHVIIRYGFDALIPKNENEDDLLDKAWGVELTSRLSCQIKMPKNHDLIIEIPKYSINQVKEIY